MAFGGRSMLRPWMHGAMIGALTIVAAHSAHAQSAAGALRTAQAQDADLFARDRSVSVRQRPRPEYEALGAPVGTFLAFPKVEFALESNDNIFAVTTSEDDDLIGYVRPELALESTWSRHFVSAFARGSVARYQDFDTEDFETWGAGLSGRLDVVRGTAVDGGVEYAQLVEPRTSTSTPQFAAELVEYDQAQAFLALTRTVGRVRMSGRADVREFDYQDVGALNGTTIDQDDRDRVISSLTGRLDYALSPATAVFAQVTGNSRDYDVASTPLVAARDSDGYEALVGVNFELGAVSRGEIAAGYISQSFDDSRFGDIDGFGARAQIEWFPTELTTVTVSGSRTIEDAGVVGANGYLASTASARIDHELLRNVILSASASLSRDEYGGIDREDERTTLSAGGTWLVNRNIGLDLSLSHVDQDSTGAADGPDYTVNRLMLTLVTQF